MVLAKYYYLYARVDRYASEIDMQWWRKKIQRRGECCPPGCGGRPTAMEQRPVDVVFMKPPTLDVEPGAMAAVLSSRLWEILAPYFEEAYVGPCLLSGPDGSVSPIEGFVTIQVPVRHQVCFRHDGPPGYGGYEICEGCGAVRTRGGKPNDVLVMDDLRSRPAAMTMARGFVVDADLKARIGALPRSRIGYDVISVVDDPRDGRPKSLDDWPELARWRRSSNP